MNKTKQGRLAEGERGPQITFELDGEPCTAYDGETIAAAMLAAGRRSFRLSPKRQQPRSLFCGMGVCFDCLVTVDGVPNVRSCMTRIEPGMRVETGVNSEKGEGNEKS